MGENNFDGLVKFGTATETVLALIKINAKQYMNSWREAIEGTELEREHAGIILKGTLQYLKNIILLLKVVTLTEGNGFDEQGFIKKLKTQLSDEPVQEALQILLADENVEMQEQLKKIINPVS
jgi:hypothetical protein